MNLWSGLALLIVALLLIMSAVGKQRAQPVLARQLDLTS